MKSTIKSLFAVVLLVIIAFPEVVFMKGSIRNLEIMNSPDRSPKKIVSVYKEPLRAIDDGLADYGGAAMQSDPMSYFMRYSLISKQSPYWNPYIGAGVPAVEGLVDMPFSFATVLQAIFGANTDSYHIIIFTLFVGALLCLHLVMRETFSLTFSASVFGCIIYFLNGFHIANLNSNVVQPYLFFPIILYFSLNNLKKNNPISFFLSALVFSISILSTFVPTLSVVCLVTLIIICCVSVNNLSVVAIFRKVISSWFVGFLFVSFLYFPVIENLLFSDMMKSYTSRTFYPLNLDLLLSMFSSRHLWESYGRNHFLPESVFGVGVFHFGILPFMMLFYLKFKDRVRGTLTVVLLSLAIILLLRIFDVSFISYLYSKIPFYGSVGSQYLWAGFSICFVFLGSFGFYYFEQEKKSTKFVVIVVFIILFLLWSLISKYGLADTSPLVNYTFYNSKRAVYNLMVLFSLLFSGVILCLFKENLKKFSIFGFMFLVLFELLFYMNHQRSQRIEQVVNPPEYVNFIKDNLNFNRVINYGGEGFLPNLGAAFQVYQIESVTMSTNRDYYNLVDKFLMNPIDKWTTFIAFYKQQGPLKTNLDLLSFLSVKYIVVNKYMDKYLDYFSKNLINKFENERLIVFENKSVMDKVNLYSDFILDQDNSLLVPEKLSSQAFINNKDYYDYLIKKIKPYSASNKNKNDQSIARLLKYDNSYIEIEVKSSSPKVLVLNDTWHRNWTAFVNDKEEEIGRVNYAFRGIFVPEGESVVKLIYMPKSMPIALIVSLLTFVVSICFCIYYFIKRKFLNV